MEEILQFFKDKKVPIQITIDIGEDPTVHAIFKNKDGNLHKTSGETEFEALYKMKEKLFGEEIKKIPRNPNKKPCVAKHITFFKKGDIDNY